MDKGLIRTLTITTGISAVLAIVAAIVIVRACLGTGLRFAFSPASIICGDEQATGETSSNFKRLAPNEMTVISTVHEREDLSIAEGRGAEKLIDGNKKTLAAPGSNAIDYSISLLDNYEIKQMIVYWGDYGINPNYIRSWSIQSSDDGVTWKAVASGASPADDKTVINKQVTTARLRLTAESEKDWIGAYELEIIARPVR